MEETQVLRDIILPLGLLVLGWMKAIVQDLNSNNFCQIAGGASNCFLEGPYVTVTESKATNKSFSFTFKIASTEFSYVFEQLEGGKVKTTNRGILNDVYIKQK